MPSSKALIFLTILVLFIAPVAARAALFALSGHPMDWRTADWSSAGLLPKASDDPQARVLILSGRTGGLKGLLAVHSWIVIKRENARSWTRYDVVGWGNPLRLNGWAPDGRWFGDIPTVVADLRGAQAAALIPKVEAAVQDYRYANAGDYRIWPGPNSNTFVATVLRAVPELRATLPPNAVGKDFHEDGFYAGLTASRTGLEVSFWGLLGIKLGWVEGLELNFLGLVTGLDVRQPAIKLPAFGRIGLPWPTTTTTAPSAVGG